MSKKIKTYFYYLLPQRVKSPDTAKAFTKKEFGNFFIKACNYINKLPLKDKKYEYTKGNTVSWIDYCDKISTSSDVDLNIIIKSAKYNHVRKVRNTTTMEENTSAQKSKRDGDEEKTHICIRDNSNQDSYLCIIESNFYGLSDSRLKIYINWMLSQYAKISKSEYEYEINLEYVPCDGFINEIEKIKTVTLLRMVVDKKSIGDDFQTLADLDESKQTVDLIYKRKNKRVSLPKDPIKSYYNSMGNNDTYVYRIITEGIGDNGKIKIDTDLIKLKQELDVDITIETEEVDDKSFFNKVQNLLMNMRK